MEAIDHATDIVKKLVNAGYIAYFAGGWVRDYLMEHPSSDIDIATNASPQMIMELFPKTIEVGLAFGVVIVPIDHHLFEVSTFRKDVNYKSGRRPERIELSTPEEDVKRRDFTINGMFYDPLNNKVMDFVSGADDIKKGIIRTIGNPNDRFVEDRLRMIRAIRFAARFGFSIDLDTQEAIKENANTLFPAVAMERIAQEFAKMAEYPRMEMAMIEMHRLGLLSTIFPQLANIPLNEIRRRVSSFPHFPKGASFILYLMELFPKSSLEEQIDICKYLKLSARLMKLVEFMYDTNEIVFKNDDDKVKWSHIYADPHSEICLNVIAARFSENDRKTFLETHQSRKKQLEKHIERIVHQKPLISSGWLKSHDIVPGKLMGQLLREAESIAINHDFDDPEQVIALLKRSKNWPEGA